MINCGAAPRPQRLFASNRLQEGPVVRKRPEAKQARRGLTARPPQPTRVTSEGSQKAVKGRNAMLDLSVHTPLTGHALAARTLSIDCYLYHETGGSRCTLVVLMLDDHESKERRLSFDSATVHRDSDAFMDERAGF